MHENFDWKVIHEQALQKDAGLELPLIAEALAQIPKEAFETIQWVVNPTWEIFYTDMQKIADDVINYRKNSLVAR